MTDTRLDAEDLLLILSECTGPQTRVRDGGVLYASAERPNAVIFDEAVYRPVSWRVAALLHSIIRWRPLDMWNAGLAWRAATALVGLHGTRLAMPPEQRMQVTDELTSGELRDVEEIASRLEPFLTLR